MTTDGSRSMISTLRRLPTFTRELQLFLRDHAVVLEQVRRHDAALNRLEGTVRGLSESVEGLHRTMVDADPQMAYDIVTSVRDDVRALLVEVTEQANAVRDRLVADATDRATPAPVVEAG